MLLGTLNAYIDRMNLEIIKFIRISTKPVDMGELLYAKEEVDLQEGVTCRNILCGKNKKGICIACISYKDNNLEL